MYKVNFLSKKFLLGFLGVLAIGIFAITNFAGVASKEISLATYSPLGKKFGSVIPASCYWDAGLFSGWTIANGAYNGDVPNGIPVNPIAWFVTPTPQCASTCPVNMEPGPNQSCVCKAGTVTATTPAGAKSCVCSNGATNPPTCSLTCNNGAINPPACNICPQGMTYEVNGTGAGVCRSTCTNGAINPPTCNACVASETYNTATNKCEPGVCANGATNFPTCSICRAGQVIQGGNCGSTCTLTNVCMQQIQGTIGAGGQCLPPAGTDINSSCIQNFQVTTSTVNPNGTVEFSWKLPPGVGSRCGFVDLTTENARPIPGLQNLSPTTDKIRIDNIQRTTRFCLVCKFFNLTTNADLGEAQAHRWIRVLRIGEN